MWDDGVGVKVKKRKKRRRQKDASVRVVEVVIRRKISTLPSQPRLSRVNQNERGKQKFYDVSREVEDD